MDWLSAVNKWRQEAVTGCWMCFEVEPPAVLRDRRQGVGSEK